LLTWGLKIYNDIQIAHALEDEANMERLNAENLQKLHKKQAENEQQQNQDSPKDEPAAAAAGGNKKGGGRNEQKQNKDKSASAQDKYHQAKVDYDKANKMPPGQARKEAMDKAQKDMKHWQKKAAEKSETHSRKSKGQQQ